MQTRNTQEHTQLVTDYIALHTQWVAFVRESVHDVNMHAAQFTHDQSEHMQLRMHRLAMRFTAAHWEELHVRRA